MREKTAVAAGPAQASSGSQCALREGTRQSQVEELIDQGKVQVKRLRTIKNLYEAGRFSYTEFRQRMDTELARGKELMAHAFYLNNADPEEEVVKRSKRRAAVAARRRQLQPCCAFQ